MGQSMPRTGGLQTLHLHDNLVELALGLLVLFHSLSMLPFPLIPFLLKPLNLTLEMLSLDINLSQLLRSLLQVLLSLIQLLLQKLHLSCQVFPSRTVGLTLVRSCLELLDLGLGRFELLPSQG